MGKVVVLVVLVLVAVAFALHYSKHGAAPSTKPAASVTSSARGRGR